MQSNFHSRELSKTDRNYHVAPSDTDDAICSFFQCLNCPRSLTCWLLYSHREHDQLADLDCDPASFCDPLAFRDAYTATAFLSKASFLKIAGSKKQNALDKFSFFEDQCGKTNDRFRHPLSDPNSGRNAWLLQATRRKIAYVLGSFVPDEFVQSANWGPGVSTLLKGAYVSATNKFQSETGITRDLYTFLEPWFATAYPAWAAHIASLGGFQMVKGNEIVTVPKNSKTDRVIAIEPGVNLWFQKAVGSMIRRRLRRFGVDLNSQEYNQELAYEGSLDPSIATLDFSSASDSISLAVVRDLLPPEWLLVMDALRCSVGFLDEKLIRWRKFSSMGNGFTFELESLIFYAAACAVAEFHSAVGPISVFGDDVVLPSSIFKEFSSFCEYLGFTVNPRKSFSSTSCFRESCGVHYFDGLDCKPIFLKERLSNVASVYKMANGVRRLSHRRSPSVGCDRQLLPCWRLLFRRVPTALRLRISEGYGDVGFVVNFDEACPAVAGEGFEGFTSLARLEVGKTDSMEEEGLLLSHLWDLEGASTKPVALRELSNRARGNSFVLRGRVRVCFTKILIHQWYNMGPWV